MKITQSTLNVLMSVALVLINISIWQANHKVQQLECQQVIQKFSHQEANEKEIQQYKACTKGDQ